MTSTDVFLSYPHKDQAAVLVVAEALQRAGVTVWIDVESVEVFDRIHDRVAQGIATSKVALVWYSKQYSRSKPCQWELAAAWLTGDGERVLAVNPEGDAAHIRPNTILQRLFSGAGDVDVLAHQVKRMAAGFETLMGAGVSYTQPLHHGRELAGLNTFVGRMEQLWAAHDGLSRSNAAMLTSQMRSTVQLRGFGESGSRCWRKSMRCGLGRLIRVGFSG